MTHPGLPPISDAMRAEATRTPGGWIWCADPDLDGHYFTGTPAYTLLGAYKVDDSGHLTGETHINDDYRPGPSTRGYPPPQAEFERALGYVACGWLPHSALLNAALQADFILETDGAGGLRIGVLADGRRFLAVYSSPSYVPAGANAPQMTTGTALLPVLNGTLLVVNPGGQMSVELPGDDLIAYDRATRSSN